MKFLKCLVSILSNQQGNFEATDYDMSKYEESSQESEESNAQEVDNQPEGGQGNDDEMSLEEQLTSFNLENEEGKTEASNLLDMVNGLGMVNNGLPFEVESDDQVKELIMKGYDYTQKTQALADERSQFQSEVEQERQAFAQEREQFEQERSAHQEVLLSDQIFTDILSQLRETEPEVFQDIQRAFQQQMSLYQNTMNNPVLKGYEQKLSELESQLTGKREQDIDSQAQQIQKAWSDGLSEVQTSFGPKLKSLGIKPNWQKVQDTWISDSSKQMTVQGALFAVYGDQITKALESAKKVATTKAQSAQRRPVESGAVGGNNQNKRPLSREELYQSVLEKSAQKHA